MNADPNSENTDPDAIITKSQAESFSKIKGTLASMGFDVESTSDIDVVAMLTDMLTHGVDVMLANKLQAINTTVDSKLKELDAYITSRKAEIDSQYLRVAHLEHDLSSLLSQTPDLSTLMQIASLSRTYAYSDSSMQIDNARNYFPNSEVLALIRTIGVMIEKHKSCEGWKVV